MEKRTKTSTGNIWDVESDYSPSEISDDKENEAAEAVTHNEELAYTDTASIAQTEDDVGAVDDLDITDVSESGTLNADEDDCNPLWSEYSDNEKRVHDYSMPNWDNWEELLNRDTLRAIPYALCA